MRNKIRNEESPQARYYRRNKEKIASHVKKRRMEDPEKIRLIERKSYHKHIETRRQDMRNRIRENPEKNRANYIKWAKNNPGKRNALRAFYRAAKLQATPKWLTKEQKQEIDQYYIDAKELQWLSDPTDPLTVDHIIPLRGKIVSGLHVPWNLQILLKSLNSSKHNKIS